MFEIHEVSVDDGAVALSKMPGRGSYPHDVAAIAKWGADMVITMVTLPELQRHEAEGLGADLHALGIDWRHLPITDFGAPDAKIEAEWPAVAIDAQEILTKGGKILVHCYGGCGRSGMIALRLMVLAGEAPDIALKRLRTVRPCAVETDDQLAWASAPI